MCEYVNMCGGLFVFVLQFINVTNLGAWEGCFRARCLVTE